MSTYQKNSDMLCLKCNVPVQGSKTCLTYLGFNFNTILPRCPFCGQAYKSQGLIKGKMSEVEMSLEDM